MGHLDDGFLEIFFKIHSIFYANDTNWLSLFIHRFTHYFCDFYSQHATALELLKDHLKEGDKALDVGSGSGYLTACMAIMVGKFGCNCFADVSVLR